jgi:hypothetical protein
MARREPAGLLGIHVNFAQMVPPDILGHIRNGDPAPADLSETEKRAYEQVAFATYHRGYGVIQGTRPQTIGYSLADTPVGLAAWLLDHDATTYAHLAQLFAGHPYGAITQLDGEGLSQADLLQRSRTRRPLRCLGTTATAFRRAARGVPHIALKGSARNTTHGCAVTRMPRPDMNAFPRNRLVKTCTSYFGRRPTSRQLPDM